MTFDQCLGRSTIALNLPHSTMRLTSGTFDSVWQQSDIIAPGTDDEEIKELLRKYAPELTCESITREEGTGSHPGAILELTGGTIDSAENLITRLRGMYRKELRWWIYRLE